MLILPAIDIRRGKCVRLYQGHPDHETVYADDPVEMAKFWKNSGAKMLHVVDLDGAFEGKPVHLPMITTICRETNLPIEVGGGFRDLPSIQKALDCGVEKVILGTAAIRNLDLISEAIKLFGNIIMVSIDIRNSYVTVSGWKELTTIPFVTLAVKMRELGVSEFLFTDTQRDGTLDGINLNTVNNFINAAQVPVTVSGGITTLEDIQNLKELEPRGLKGAVIGKALYDDKIRLVDAMRIAGHAG